jgi:hypothetical protein
VKYAFIAQHRTIFPINAMCRVLKASRSGFYAWEGREPSLRAQENAQLVMDLQRVHVQSRENYGVVKAWKALQLQGISCGRNRVARLRAAHDIYARRRRRFIATTRSRRTPGAPNLLDQQFHAPRPNQIWATDVTFIATRQGWLFLAVMIEKLLVDERGATRAAARSHPSFRSRGGLYLGRMARTDGAARHDDEHEPPG